MGLEDVIRFRGVLDKTSAMAEMRASAALFTSLRNDPVFALTVPSKVFDYMMADRPILFGLGSAEARAIMMESGGNRAFAPDDIASLCSAIINVAGALPELEAKARANSGIVQARFTREAATREPLVALATATANGRGPGRANA
jgi:hypothetical protein